MTTILALTGKNANGDTLTVSNDIENGDKEARRKTQYRLGRDFNGGAVISAYVYNVENSVYAYVKPVDGDWAIDFSNSAETVTRSLGDAHISTHSADDLKLKPESRDWGPAVEALASEIFKSLSISAQTQSERLRAEVSEKDALIAKLMATLTPAQRKKLLES